MNISYNRMYTYGKQLCTQMVSKADDYNDIWLNKRYYIHT